MSSPSFPRNSLTIEDVGLRLELMRDKMLSVARKYTSSRTEAEDLVQDTILKALRFCAYYDPKHQFATWVFSIMRNTSRDQHRATKNQPMLPLEHFAPSNVDPEELAINRIFADQLVEIAEDCSKRDAPLIYDHMIGLSSTELAARYGISPTTIRTRLHRLREKVRARVK